MAREQRKDVDYFPHDCTHGRKMHIIETRYGNDGYAVWFKLLEQLGKANNHFIDISDEMTLMFLTSTFKIEEEKTILILNDLAKLGAIDKVLYEQHKVIWSQKFVNSISDAYRKRKMELYTKDDILQELNKSSANLPPIPRGLEEKLQENEEKHVNLPSEILKVDKSKVKDSKEEEIIVKDIIVPKKHTEILSIFHSVCIDLPVVQKITPERTESLNLIEKEYGLESIGIVFSKINESDYLNGKGKDGWKADFDWILKPSNFIKILEDRYKNRKNGQSGKTNAEIYNDAINSETGKTFNWGKG